MSSMNRQNTKNINLLVSEMPARMVLPSNWLNQQGVSRKLIWAYVKSGWLRQLANKAYCRTDELVTWFGLVHALQSYLKLPIHIGGKSALVILGRSHFLPIAGLKVIDLFKNQQCSLPKWFNQIKEIKVDVRLSNTQLFSTDITQGIIEKEIEGINIKLSAPERAILEILNLVPSKQTYEEALLLMEGLIDMRPKLINTLLQQCNSIKTKRLFLHMADKYMHPWLNKLDMEFIELGHGKRQIGKGGVYDKKYQLSVPQIRNS